MTSTPGPESRFLCQRLLAALDRLTGIANGYRQGANKDVARFADEVEALCRRWEK